MQRHPKDVPRAFARRVINLFSALPDTVEAQMIGQQLLRSSTFYGCQLQRSMRRSRKELLATLSMVVEAADEALFWLAAAIPQEKLVLDSEVLQELLVIFSASRKTAKNNLSQ